MSKPQRADQRQTKRGTTLETRTIDFGPYQLQPPVLFAGYRMGDVPTAGLRSFPWKLTGTEALLINAYDFTRPKYKRVIENGWNPKRDLKFSKGPLLIDSGAYYFLRDRDVAVDPRDILKIELRSQAHVGVILDHPFLPEAKDKGVRITRTLSNTKIMLCASRGPASEFELMPVVHGHSRKMLQSCIKRLQYLSCKYGNGKVQRVGVGSVAPFAQRGDARRATGIIATVRELLPAAHVHCFSMGSPLLMLLAIYAGADTVDSQTWIVSAAFKYAQVPGSYAVRLARRDYATYARFRSAIKNFGETLMQLHKREGFTTKDWPTGEAISLDSLSDCEDYSATLTDLKSNENVHNRACHNLWVYNYEIRQFRQALRAKALDTFLEGRIAESRYGDVFRFLQQRRKKNE